MADELRLIGVAEPPFRHLDLTIPKKTWLTVRGPVASGKNALIAKAVYGECQRRFLATLPPYWQEQLAVPPPPKLTRMTGAMPALLWRHEVAQAKAGDETMADALGWRSAWQQLLASQGRLHCPVHQQPVTTTATLTLPEPLEPPEPEPKPEAERKPEPSQGRFAAICLPELGADEDPGRMEKLTAACQKLGLMRLYRAGRLWPIPAALEQGGALVADIVALTSAEQVAAATTKALASWTALTRPGAAGEHLAGLGQTVTLVEAFPDLTAAAFVPPVTATAAGHCPVAGCGFAAALVPETGADFSFAGQSYSFLSALRLSTGRLSTDRQGSIGYDDGLHLTVAAAAKLLAGHGEPNEEQGPRRQLKAALTMGLGSLSLATPICRLSAGQRQRLALCSAALCAASDYLVLLFYPSAHLDQQGIAALAPRLTALREQGNSLIVVDNHPALAAAAAQVLTLTPMSGGQPQTTWQALAKPAQNSKPGDASSSLALSQALDLGQAQAANPDHILVELAGARLPLPLSGALAIAGPNGAGKTRLLAELAAHLKAAGAENHRDIPALRLFAPKAAPQSATTVASLLGIWQPLRLLYSRLPEANALGITAKDFLASEYRCPACSTPAPGSTTVDSRADCTACLGSGLSHRLVGIRYKGYSLSQFLALTLTAAQDLVARVPTLAGPLAIALALPGLAELPLATPVARLSKGTILILQLAGFLAAGPRHKRVIVALESSSFTHLHPRDREALHRASAAILADQGRGLIVTCTEPAPYHQAPLWLALSRPAAESTAESTAESAAKPGPKPADPGTFMPLSCQFFSHKMPV